MSASTSGTAATTQDAGRISFASGSKGLNVRADGKGGFLPRGFYFWTYARELLGPFDTEAQAALVRSSLHSRSRLCEAELIGGEFAALRALRRKGIMAKIGVRLMPEARAALSKAGGDR